MKFAILPNALKESASAIQAGAAIAGALSRHFPASSQYILPVSDGGDGFTDICINKFELQKLTCDNTSNYFTHIKQFPVAVSADKTTWYAATADMIGLAATPAGLRNPLVLNSAPVAVLIAEVVKRASGDGTALFLGVGGTATNDLGLGSCGAFGLQLLDRKGAVLPLRPASFTLTREITLPSRAEHISLFAITDVNTPVSGKGNFTEVFAPQKGASAKDVLQLSLGVENLLRIFKSQHGITFPAEWGAGGGILCGLSLLMPVTVVPAAGFISNTLGAEQLIKQCDAVITCEGRFDSQSVGSKAAGTIMQLCGRYGKPCYVICGSSAIPAGSRLPEKVTVIEMAPFFNSAVASINNPMEGIQKAVNALKNLLGK